MGDEMNRIHKFLLDLAEQNAKVYEAMPEVQAIIIGGSVSRGKPTLYSDIDTIIICQQLPHPDRLAEACRTNGGLHHETVNQDEDGLLEHYYLHNIECQFAWSKVEEYDRRLKQVLDDESLDPINHMIMSGTMDARVVYGQEYVASLRQRLAQFPRGLQVKMVEKFIGVLPVEEIRLRLLREESLIWFYSVLTATQRGILGSLFGLNRLYHPGGFRKIDYHIAKMQIAPSDLYPRLNNMFSVPPADALAALADIYRETIDLIGKHLPEADIAEARKSIVMKLIPMNLP